MARAEQTTIDFLTAYFATLEAKDLPRLGEYYAEDMTLTFANAPTVTGREVVLAQMASLLAKVDTLAHPLINVWQEQDGVVILEVASDWRFPDGHEQRIIACSIFTVVEGRFTDQRIYVDNSPINDRLA